ncbi:hypothetical protein JQK87_13150 [Streptomyces sp. G44]|uniref:hypothetical protein n=1 Tax=Streptomyces sp. G44 TaxID=2807632 RepID=UPI00195F9A66|nr:hypothetical protein [Streptomyces sp. G44]MBM7169346.1 hypothetical protein [Streptomyces sp. G44]
MDAPQVLAERRVRRLNEQMGAGGPIAAPAGWLLIQGLPQRQQYGDTWCDARGLLDSAPSSVEQS